MHYVLENLQSKFWWEERKEEPTALVITGQLPWWKGFGNSQAYFWSGFPESHLRKCAASQGCLRAGPEHFVTPGRERVGVCAVPESDLPLRPVRKNPAALALSSPTVLLSLCPFLSSWEPSASSLLPDPPTGVSYLLDSRQLSSCYHWLCKEPNMLHFSNRLTGSETALWAQRWHLHQLSLTPELLAITLNVSKYLLSSSYFTGTMLGSGILIE